MSPLAEAQRAAIARYHDRVLERLADQFDIDRTVAERRMSVGMRLASGFGAATLTAAVVSFLYQVWGAIPTTGQVVLRAPAASAKQLFRDCLQLEVRRPFVDLSDLRVAIQLLDGVILDESVAAIEVDGQRGGALGNL